MIKIEKIEILFNIILVSEKRKVRLDLNEVFVFIVIEIYNLMGWKEKILKFIIIFKILEILKFNFANLL